MTREITNCEEALRVLAEHLDDELDAVEEGQLLHHLETCRSCYSRAEFERQLKAQMHALAREPVPSSVAHRVQQLLCDFDPSPNH